MLLLQHTTGKYEHQALSQARRTGTMHVPALATGRGRVPEAADEPVCRVLPHVEGRRDGRRTPADIGQIPQAEDADVQEGTAVMLLPR